MIIVDSSVWIDALRGVPSPHTLWFYNVLGNRPIGLTSLILAEVLHGVLTDAELKQTRLYLVGFPILEDLSSELAIQSALNYRRLRKSGVTVRKTIDCLIATFCIEEGHELLHRDRDFDHFEKHLGLQVVHP